MVSRAAQGRDGEAAGALPALYRPRMVAASHAGRGKAANEGMGGTGMTTEQLDELERLGEELEGCGPFRAIREEGDACPWVLVNGSGYWLGLELYQFAAAAMNATPYLLKEIQRLRAMVGEDPNVAHGSGRDYATILLRNIQREQDRAWKERQKVVTRVEMHPVDWQALQCFASPYDVQPVYGGAARVMGIEVRINDQVLPGRPHYWYANSSPKGIW